MIHQGPKDALRTEIAYAEARGGVASRMDDFIHVYNTHVPWAGDYNRALGIQARDLQTFRRILRRIQELHQTLALSSPDSFDTYPSLEGDGAWILKLPSLGLRASRDLYLWAPAEERDLEPNLEWYLPDPAEYMKTWLQDQRYQPYYDDTEFKRRDLPLQRMFVRVFRPYWLRQDGWRVATVFGARVDEVFRLFSVEVEKSERGRRLGTSLLDGARSEAARQGAERVILRCREAQGRFYEQAGFTVCARGTMIRA